MLRFMVFFILIIIAPISVAGGWTGKVKIEGVYLLNETTGIATLSSFNDPEECWSTSSGNDDAGHIYFNPQTQKSWFTLILMAYATKKDVNVYVSGGCQPIWTNSNFAKIGHIRAY